MIKLIGRIILYALAFVAWIWGIGTIYFGPWPLFVRLVVGVFWVLVAWEFLRPVNPRRRWTRFSIAFALIGLLWACHRPTGVGNWAPDQQFVPLAIFDGDTVRIENVRNATYQSASDFDVQWETRTYDLNTIKTVDFVLEPFAMDGNLAHTFLTFGFANGQHIAVSVEIRKEVGDKFSPLRGLFKKFELTYVIGDERDLIGLRANVRNNPVRLYPCAATPDQVRILFTAMLQRTNSLAERPEFYHSLHNTCTSNITWHLEQLGWQDWRLDRRLIFPGKADEIGFERGLLVIQGGLANARQQYRINQRSAFGVDSVEWSRQIRGK